ncbi:hypothetical protein FHS51_001076 [Sphingobium wenxiniae]|uniref:hypothetical protein n=1 Tax=Sphingobium wenxiniae (strain DSM 21828 / CGMCC 1.7748 / JZ-1) TaxID=595605 RepID=UPI0013152C18|nr:hypothetical protein [Sphingobium wenxiniae]
MALAGNTNRTADQTDQRITGLLGRCLRAWVIGPAGAIHFSRCDTRQTDARAFGAPDRPIAVPHPDGRAGEGFSRGRDGRNGKQQKIENRHDLGVGGGSRLVTTHS